MKKMIKNKEYTSVDCVWLYAYVKVRISPVSICPGEHMSAHRVYYPVYVLAITLQLQQNTVIGWKLNTCVQQIFRVSHGDKNKRILHRSVA